MNPSHHRKRNFLKGQAHHVVLSSELQVFWGAQVRGRIDSVLKKYSKHFKIKIYHRAMVGNHIHLILQAESSTELAGFLRVIAGQIATKIKPIGLKKCFWKSRPWSRLLTWGKDYGTATKYLALNYLEGIRKVIRSKKVKNELNLYKNWIETVLEKGLTRLNPVPIQLSIPNLTFS